LAPVGSGKHRGHVARFHRGLSLKLPRHGHSWGATRPIVWWNCDRDRGWGTAMACPAAAHLRGGLVGIDKRCRRLNNTGRVRGLIRVVELWRAHELYRGRGLGWGCGGHIAVACPAGAGLPSWLVGVSKHRGLGVGHDSGDSILVAWANVADRDRGSAGSRYGRSLSLVVATTRTRSLVGV